MAVEGQEEEEDSHSNSTSKLSHKQFKRLIQKERRRLKRQEEAKRREKEELEEKTKIDNDPLLRAKLEAEERRETEKRRKEEEERAHQHQLWLAREAAAQEEFRKNKEEEERKLREKIEQERKIKEEWEEEQRKEREAEEKKQQKIREKEDALFREIDKPAVPSSKGGEAWHNPLAPPTNSNVYGTEQDTVNCSFYLKTGACRFGDRCSRQHPKLPSSVTLLIPSMYQDIGLSQSMLDEADHDASLEYDEKEAYERFVEFYEDVVPEFQSVGTMVQFKVCCNNEPHLRGNVYVQYQSEEECAAAFAKFNGRWFAGKQCSCEFSPVTKWKSAICGLFERKRCTRGKNCNFLHVYHNPGNAFWRMDRDLETLTEPGSARSYRSNRGTESRRGGDWERDERDFERDWDRRRDSDRSYRGHRKRNWDWDYDRELNRDRGRNGDRDRGRHRDRDGDRGRDRDRDRDRDDRGRDGGRDRDRDREDRNRDRDREDRNRDRDRRWSIQRDFEEGWESNRHTSYSRGSYESNRQREEKEIEEHKDRFGRDRRRNSDSKRDRIQSRDTERVQDREKDNSTCGNKETEEKVEVDDGGDSDGSYEENDSSYRAKDKRENSDRRRCETSVRYGLYSSDKGKTCSGEHHQARGDLVAGEGRSGDSSSDSSSESRASERLTARDENESLGNDTFNTSSDQLACDKKSRGRGASREHDRHRHKSKKRRHKHKKKYKRKRSNKSRECDSESEESVNGTENEEFDNSMRHRKYRKVDA